MFVTAVLTHHSNENTCHGATGFIGSYVLSELLKKDFDI